MAAATHSMRLAPWHDDLKAFWSPWNAEHKDLTLLEGEECILWLRVPSRITAPLAIPSNLGRVCEALRLLELLARTDFDAWVHEMFTLWPGQVYRAWVEFKLKPVASVRLVRIGLMVTASTTADVDLCMSFATHNAADATPSEQYLRSREELLQDCENPPSDEQWRVPICIEYDYSVRRGSDYVIKMLQSTVAVKKRMFHAGREEEGAVRPRFVLHEVCSAVLSDGHLRTESLMLLLELAKLGVRIGDLPILGVACPRWKEHEVMKQVAEALRYLTAQDDDDVNRTNRGLRSVVVSHRHSKEIAIALLSAVEKSRNVRQVEIDLYEEQDSDEEGEDDDDDDDERGGDWEWVAYHLFSRFANHNVDTLRMNLRDLRVIEVDAVRDVLADKNPLARLDGRNDDCGRLEPQIIASRFCVLLPAELRSGFYEDIVVDHKSDKYMYTTPAPVTVRVISKPVEGEGPWWLVLLPGLGFAWVHEEDVLSFVPWSSEDDALTRPTFPSVVITTLGSNSKESSVDLLKLIGQGTSRVELHEYEDDEPLDEWCGSVLGGCPQLGEFQLLAGAMEKLRVIASAAESGQCRLRQLKVQYVETSETAEHVNAFFSVLRDPLHPLTTHLQQLDLNFIIRGGKNLNEIVDSAVWMLETNRRLQHVRLGFNCLDDAQTHKVTIDRAFQPQLKAKVPVRVAPLGLTCKLAFLSVVDQQLATGEALSRLDSGVMAEIFRFAAVSRDRLLQVNVPILP